MRQALRSSSIKSRLLSKSRWIRENATQSKVDSTDAGLKKPVFSEDLRYKGGVLSVGHWESLAKHVGDADIVAFSNISQDTNPIHLDDEYASKSIFKKRIAHGMLCASPISAVAGTKLPGPGSIYLSQTLQFRRPVFVGDTVTAYVKVTDIRDAKCIVSFDTNVYNQHDELVISGQALVKVTADKINKVSK